MQPQLISWNALQIGEALGAGSFGEVFKAKWQNKTVAVKQLFLKRLPAHLIKDFENETSVLAKCQCEQIVRLYGVCRDEGYLSIVMEFAERGSLYQLLRNETDLDWRPTRYQIAYDLVKGIAYLHEQNILHRDLKSLNILITSLYRAKITDFGLAKIKTETSSTTTNSGSAIGTTRWQAPELFKRGVTHSKPSDVYSCGMVLWEIGTGKIPYSESSNEITVSGWIKDGEKETIPNNWSQAYRQIIEEAWNIEPNKRITAQKMAEQLSKLCGMDSSSTPLSSSSSSTSPSTTTLYRPITNGTSSSFHYGSSNSPKRSPHVANSSTTLASAPLETPDRRIPAEKLYELGWQYANGSGVQKDDTKAVYYYRLSAEKGYATAQYTLAFCYEEGTGIMKDMNQAFHYYNLAAQQKDKNAQYALALCYTYGKGTKQDDNQAFTNCKLAADQGHDSAQHYLGYCYYSGTGTQKNLEMAIYYYQEAANQGHSKAQSSLQKCLAEKRSLSSFNPNHVSSSNLKSPDRQINTVGSSFPRNISGKIAEDTSSKNVIPEMALGKEIWEKHFGSIEAEPPLPKNIDQILNAPCPFWPGKKIKDTHILVLIPKTINNQPLSLNVLDNLARNPKMGSATELNFSHDKRRVEIGNCASGDTQWALMTKDIVPKSTDKMFQDQVNKLYKYTKDYTFPEAYEAAACILLHFLSTGERLFSKKYIRCRTKSAEARAEYNREEYAYPEFYDCYYSIGCFEKNCVDIVVHVKGKRCHDLIGFAAIRYL